MAEARPQRWLLTISKFNNEELTHSKGVTTIGGHGDIALRSWKLELAHDRELDRACGACFLLLRFTHVPRSLDGAIFAARTLVVLENLEIIEALYQAVIGVLHWLLKQRFTICLN